jgi:hypothetical protein
MAEEEIFEEFETDVINSDVIVGGVFIAGNWAIGSVVITPIPNQPTAFIVSGLDLSGDGDINYNVSVKTNQPWQRVKGVSVAAPGIRTFEIRIYRTNNTATRIHYFVYRDPS